MKIKIHIKGIIITLVVLFIGFYMAWNFQHTLTTSNSPEKNNKIVVKYITPFSFGEHKIKIYYGPKKNFLFIKKTFTTYLDNDGMAIDHSNYKIDWIDENTAEIQLIAFKLIDTKRYIIDFKTGETHEIQEELTKASI